jgi:ferredoxin
VGKHRPAGGMRGRPDSPLELQAGGWVERSVGGRTYRIARVVEEFDWIVNVPKFKTHILTLLTGAVKNVFGCVPGLGKSMFHVANPKPAAMSRVLVDVFSLVRPAVTLVDAVDAMDGNGPSSGRVRHLGFIAAGQDAVAVDAVLAAVVGLDPLAIPTTREAWTRGLGEARLDAIAINGAAVEDVTVSDFKVPSNWGFALLPNALARLAGRFFWARPVAGAGACTGCGDCARICAARAIKVADGKAVIDRSKCVSCLCCIEICPVGAIGARKSSLARLAT